MKQLRLALIIAATLAAWSGGAHASGYRFGSQSLSAQGSADANTAEAADPSTIFYNPAGLSRLSGRQLSAGATVVVPHSTFSDTGSTRFTGTSSGGSAADGYAPSAVVAPALYFSQQIDSQWTIGAGLFVPYGAKLGYGDSWTGRYSLTDIKLEAITVNPSASFKLNERHSFGFGVSAEHMKAHLGQAVDVPGGVRVLSGTPAGNALIAALGPHAAALAGVQDGHATSDGQDWGYGFNLGYLFQLDAATRFGLAYRSSISHSLKGDATWDFSHATTDPVTNAVLANASGKKNSAALVKLQTPETVSASVFRQIDPKWAAMADLTWTRTSRFANLNIQFPGTAEGDEVIRQHWKNTYRLSLGANYRYSEQLLLRAGVAYDQSPVRSAELTHPALPDSDRYQISFGANYKLGAQSSLDFAYSYLDFKNARANYHNDCTPLPTSTTCTGNGETTRGLYKTRLQLLGVAYNYQF
jgi:long-chain fatty acid transport protein